jgi:YesN/AraC family two-component response regulator
MSNEMLAELSGTDKALITYLSNDECDAFENICNSLDLLKSSESFSDSDVANKLVEILLDMFYLSFSSRKKARVASHEPQDKIQQILDWMQMHYRTYINADDIAKQFHFNTAYLRRLFKERVGVSIMQYLKELRLEYAKNLLLTTGLKISEVCDRSGYRSMPTFISDFKQKYQHAPLAFREKFAADNE